MPFNSTADLPDRVKAKYGAKAQRAYMQAFNSAFEGTCREGGRQGSREGCSHAVATQAAQRVQKRNALLKMAAFWLELRQRPTKKLAKSPWARSTPIVKVDEEKQIAYGPVLEPLNEHNPDAQEDWYTDADIEAAAHRFMLKAQLGKASADGINHDRWVGHDKAHVVESWVTHEDTQYGDDTVRKGTWMMGVHVIDKELWASVKSGELTGFSIGGRGIRV